MYGWSFSSQPEQHLLAFVLLMIAMIFLFKLFKTQLKLGFPALLMSVFKAAQLQPRAYSAPATPAAEVSSSPGLFSGLLLCPLSSSSTSWACHLVQRAVQCADAFPRQSNSIQLHFEPPVDGLQLLSSQINTQTRAGVCLACFYLAI